MNEPAALSETVNEEDGPALDRLGAEFNVSREAVLSVMKMVGPQTAEVRSYLQEWGAPSETP